MDVRTFQIMTRRQNRHMSIAVYISVLAVADNITLLIGKFSYNTKHEAYVSELPKSPVVNIILYLYICGDPAPGTESLTLSSMKEGFQCFCHYVSNKFLEKKFQL